MFDRRETKGWVSGWESVDRVYRSCRYIPGMALRIGPDSRFFTRPYAIISRWRKAQFPPNGGVRLLVLLSFLSTLSRFIPGNLKGMPIFAA